MEPTHWSSVEQGYLNSYWLPTKQFMILMLIGSHTMQVACWLLDPGSKEHTLHSMVTNFSPAELPLLAGISPGQGVQSLGMGADSSHTGRYRAAVESVLVFSTMAQLTSLLEKDRLLGLHFY